MSQVGGNLDLRAQFTGLGTLEALHSIGKVPGIAVDGPETQGDLCFDLRQQFLSKAAFGTAEVAGEESAQDIWPLLRINLRRGLASDATVGGQIAGDFEGTLRVLLQVRNDLRV